MIKLANGLLTPTQGTILVDGKEPGIETKKIVSYLPERTYLTEWMTVQDMLDLFNDFYADFNIAKARDMLARLNIQTKARIKTMSKGHQGEGAADPGDEPGVPSCICSTSRSAAWTPRRAITF